MAGWCLATPPSEGRLGGEGYGERAIPSLPRHRVLPPSRLTRGGSLQKCPAFPCRRSILCGLTPGPQLLPEAGAQLTLEAISSRPWFGVVVGYTLAPQKLPREPQAPLRRA